MTLKLLATSQFIFFQNMESQNFIQETSNQPEKEIENNQSSFQQKPVQESQTVFIQNNHQITETVIAETQKEVEPTNQEVTDENREEKAPEAIEQTEPMEQQLSAEKKPTQAKCVSAFENDTIIYKLGRKCLKLILMKNSLRFTVVQQKEKVAESQNGAQNLEELFNPPQNDQTIGKPEIFALTNKQMVSLTQGVFRNCRTFFTFLIDNLSNQNILFMKDDVIKFKLQPQVETSAELKLNYKRIISKLTENQKIQVNLVGIEDKLLQFDLKEIELIERMQRRWRKKQQNSSGVSEQQPEEESNIEQSDIIYESEDDLLEDEPDLWIDINTIKKEIDTLENEFLEFGKKFKIPTNTQPLPQLKHTDRALSVVSTPSKPELNLFPPGYLPPHLSKPQSHNIPGTQNINSAEQLRFQANQTKKAKLKMAKEMLKLGYSTAEVIQRIQAQQRSGKDDPNSYAPPSSRKSFLPSSTASTYQPPAPSVISHQVEKAPSQNDRVVRDMFKKLLKEKRYKKLDEIQKHMEREGIHTSVAELKKILNEIRSNNAQRQKTEKQSQAE